MDIQQCPEKINFKEISTGKIFSLTYFLTNLKINKTTHEKVAVTEKIF